MKALKNLLQRALVLLLVTAQLALILNDFPLTETQSKTTVNNKVAKVKFFVSESEERGGEEDKSDACLHNDFIAKSDLFLPDHNLLFCSPLEAVDPKLTYHHKSIYLYNRCLRI